MASTPAHPPGGKRASRQPSDGPLSHIALFSRLTGQEQNALMALMRAERIEPNQTIFWLGDKGDTFYLVNDGQVLVTAPNEAGEHVELDRIEAGGFFGEISLLDGGPRTATVRATRMTELLVLARDPFHEFLRKHPDAAVEILTIMGQRQRVSTEALRQVKNANEMFEQQLTVWQRISDVVASIAASSIFTAFHLCWFGGWITLNLLGSTGLIPERLAFDPYPFGLLTMVVSLEAIFLSIFVMVSQNRSAEKDRLRIDLDYQVNLKAQTEIMALGRRLERIEHRLAGDPDEEPPAQPPAPMKH